MKFAYADPPYIGQAKRHYNNVEVDHVELLQRLSGYDAWALSASSPSLFEILPLCPSGTRVAAWVKPFASFKPNVNPAYAWEPVLFKGVCQSGRGVSTVRDWVSSNITLKRGLAGAKPRAFCFWLFELLGMEAGDVLHDLYPGTGIVGQCWDEFCARSRGIPVQGEML